MLDMDNPVYYNKERENPGLQLSNLPALGVTYETINCTHTFRMVYRLILVQITQINRYHLLGEHVQISQIPPGKTCASDHPDLQIPSGETSS